MARRAGEGEGAANGRTERKQLRLPTDQLAFIPYPLPSPALPLLLLFLFPSALFLFFSMPRTKKRTSDLISNAEDEKSSAEPELLFSLSPYRKLLTASIDQWKKNHFSSTEGMKKLFIQLDSKMKQFSSKECAFAALILVEKVAESRQSSSSMCPEVFALIWKFALAPYLRCTSSRYESSKHGDDNTEDFHFKEDSGPEHFWVNRTSNELIGHMASDFTMFYLSSMWTSSNDAQCSLMETHFQNVMENGSRFNNSFGENSFILDKIILWTVIAQSTIFLEGQSYIRFYTFLIFNGFFNDVEIEYIVNRLSSLGKEYVDSVSKMKKFKGQSIQHIGSEIFDKIENSASMLRHICHSLLCIRTIFMTADKEKVIRKYYPIGWKWHHALYPFLTKFIHHSRIYRHLESLTEDYSTSMKDMTRPKDDEVEKHWNWVFGAFHFRKEVRTNQSKSDQRDWITVHRDLIFLIDQNTLLKELMAIWEQKLNHFDSDEEDESGDEDDLETDVDDNEPLLIEDLAYEVESNRFFADVQNNFRNTNMVDKFKVLHLFFLQGPAHTFFASGPADIWPKLRSFDYFDTSLYLYAPFCFDTYENNVSTPQSPGILSTETLQASDYEVESSLRPKIPSFLSAQMSRLCRSTQTPFLLSWIVSKFRKDLEKYSKSVDSLLNYLNVVNAETRSLLSLVLPEVCLVPRNSYVCQGREPTERDKQKLYANELFIRISGIVCCNPRWWKAVSSVLIPQVTLDPSVDLRDEDTRSRFHKVHSLTTARHTLNSLKATLLMVQHFLAWPEFATVTQRSPQDEGIELWTNQFKAGLISMIFCLWSDNLCFSFVAEDIICCTCSYCRWRCLATNQDCFFIFVEPLCQLMVSALPWDRYAESFLNQLSAIEFGVRQNISIFERMILYYQQADAQDISPAASGASDDRTLVPQTLSVPTEPSAEERSFAQFLDEMESLDDEKNPENAEEKVDEDLEQEDEDDEDDDDESYEETSQESSSDDTSLDPSTSTSTEPPGNNLSQAEERAISEDNVISFSVPPPPASSSAPSAIRIPDSSESATNPPTAFSAFTSLMAQVQSNAQQHLQFMGVDANIWQLSQVASLLPRDPDPGQDDFIQPASTKISLLVSRDTEKLVKEVVQQTHSALQVRDILKESGKKDLETEFDVNLQVEFKGEEQARDLGGVRKECMELFFAAIANEKLGLWDRNEETRLLWPKRLPLSVILQNEGAIDFVKAVFSTIGALMALCIAHNIHFHLPLDCELFFELMKRDRQVGSLFEKPQTFRTWSSIEFPYLETLSRSFPDVYNALMQLNSMPEKDLDDLELDYDALPVPVKHFNLEDFSWKGNILANFPEYFQTHSYSVADDISLATNSFTDASTLLLSHTGSTPLTVQRSNLKNYISEVSNFYCGAHESVLAMINGFCSVLPANRLFALEPVTLARRISRCHILTSKEVIGLLDWDSYSFSNVPENRYAQFKKDFCEILSSMTPVQLEKFMRFCTSSVAPSRVKITFHGGNMPFASSCFNQLLINVYSKPELRKALDIALENCRGFGNV